ncbi:MAG TPA: hypothetical protein VNR00_13615 [Opitutus sp.]|nr:hypothetical protein [Opitutus sp.]
MSTHASFPALSARQWRQIGVITLAALGTYAFMRWLPTGTNLSHMDFRVDAQNSIEFCDPLNPQFIPVVAVASPIAMSIAAPPAVAGRPVRATVVLKTASGKPIAPADLLVVHTRRLHLMIVDPALKDYQHLHPDPVGDGGRWEFEFTPLASGVYRVFADFTPAATNRGLYAHADLRVAAPEGAAPEVLAARTAASGLTDDYDFKLTPRTLPLRAKQTIDLRFTVARKGGGTVPLEPVMDAYAHLVAFDESRSGFAHLHPAEADLSQKPDATHPELNFKITIPRAGRYVIWSQVNLGGHEAFVPFRFDVVD